jgi:hypothetical protein
LFEVPLNLIQLRASNGHRRSEAGIIPERLGGGSTSREGRTSQQAVDQAAATTRELALINKMLDGSN